MAHLEANNNLSPTQSGYRKHRIIKYQLALLAREIKNAFQLKKKTVAVFYYLSKAFDKVWREGLLLKVLQVSVSGRMYKWIRCFLRDRSARVKVDGHLSDSEDERRCTTGGCCFANTLPRLY